jgi:CubicO group peptidase (beta-lactamase class C family)
MKSCCLVLALVIGSGGLASAQTPQLPPPEKTDPVALGLMQGFPPAADKTVSFSNVLKFPNGRWAFHHMRELGSTVNVWRGEAVARPLKAELKDLGAISFSDDKEGQTTIADWQKNTFTDGLLVLHKGKIVYEKRYSGMRSEQPHSLWSVTKSFTGLLATMMIGEGKLDPNAKISQYLPELEASAWGDATLQQTLDMTTAVQYREVFTDPKSELFQYLIAGGLLPAPADYPGARTLPDYLKTVKKEGEHGFGFRYKSVDTEVVGWVLERVSGKSFSDLVSERIWQPIGAEQDGYVWAGPTGAQVTSIGLSVTLRDLGRFAEMLRQDGLVDGRQVVPKGAIDEIRKGGDREKFKAGKFEARNGYSYHNHWWVSHDADGSYEAKGLNHQHIHINPAAELVIVKLSSHPAGETIFTHVLDRNAFKAIAQAIRQ